MGYETYSQLNNLEEVSFIAGTEYTFLFTCYQDDGVTPLNLYTAGITWYLSNYGDDTAIVTKTIGSGITITGTNTFRVVLDSTSSLDLRGKYIQQVSIRDYANSTFRPGQGIVTVLPAIHALSHFENYVGF